MNTALTSYFAPPVASPSPAPRRPRAVDQERRSEAQSADVEPAVAQASYLTAGPAAHKSALVPVVLLHLVLGMALWQGFGPKPVAPKPELIELKLLSVAAPVPPPPPQRRVVEPTPPVMPALAVPAPPLLALNPLPTITLAVAPSPSPASPGPVVTQPVAAPAPQPQGPKDVAASEVQYLSPPAIAVPAMSVRMGESGVVVLRVVVDVNGLPRQVSVQKSSGYNRLDEQALKAMRAARFKPYVHDGQPMEMAVLTPVQYELNS